MNHNKTITEKLNSMGLTNAQKKEVLGLMMGMCTFQNIALGHETHSYVLAAIFVNGLRMPYVELDPSFLADKRIADAIGVELE